MCQHTAMLIENVNFPGLAKVHVPYQVPQDAHVQPRSYHATITMWDGHHRVRDSVGRDLDWTQVGLPAMRDMKPVGLADGEYICEHRCCAKGAAYDAPVPIHLHDLQHRPGGVAQQHMFGVFGSICVSRGVQFANGSEHLACPVEEHG